MRCFCESWPRPRCIAGWTRERDTCEIPPYETAANKWTAAAKWYVTLTNDHAWMYAACRSKSGAKITSRLDLNYCVGNSNGKLVADEG